MSKIEKALSRAKEERGGLQLISPAGVSRSPGTALLPERVAHPETIPRMTAAERGLLGPRDLSARGFIAKHDVDDPSVQVFRGLRTRIVQESKGSNCIVLVAGVSEGSGATFVARNLGAAFAFDKGKTALIIDCNFRRPTLHGLVAAGSPPGLTDYLDNPNIDAGKIIHPVGIARLRVIPAGRRVKSDTEHFTSVKMRHVMSSLRERYAERFIVLDAPPMTDTSDIRVLSEFADHVLLVARYGRDTRARIEKCAGAFPSGKLLGLVFNDEPGFPGRHAGNSPENAAEERVPPVSAG